MSTQCFAALHAAFGPINYIAPDFTYLETSLAYYLWKVRYLQMEIWFGCKECVKNPVVLKSWGTRGASLLSLKCATSLKEASSGLSPCHTLIACSPLSSWLFLLYRHGFWTHMAPEISASSSPAEAWHPVSSLSSSLPLFRAWFHS